MQTAETFQESTVREFIRACNAGSLADIFKYLHPAIHYQSYAGGLPDVTLEGIENIQLYLEGRSATQNHHYTIYQLECKGRDVRIVYECSVTNEQQHKGTHTGTLICIFVQGKIFQLVETS